MYAVIDFYLLVFVEREMRRAEKGAAIHHKLQNSKNVTENTVTCTFSFSLWFFLCVYFCSSLFRA